MIEEALVNHLTSIVTPVPVYYSAIPQSVSTRPVVVVEPPSSFDMGNTAVRTVPQKLSRFCIAIYGTTQSSLISPREAIFTFLNGIAAGSSQTQIGPYRCQSIIIEDVEASSIEVKNQVNDRRQPGADQQAFAYCYIHCFASYHRNPL